MDKVLQLLEVQAQLLKELGIGNGDMHTKAPAAFHTATELHGNGSLWGRAPVERDIISAHVRPRGMAEALPIYPSVVENPIFGSITGYTATSGSEPVNPCDPAPAGYVKGCNLSAQFGRVARDTQTIEIDKVMLTANRGDFTDLRLRGQVLGMLGPFTPGGMTQDDILTVVTKSEMVIVGVNIERKLAEMLWQGNPANNTAGGGYKEFPGLDRQIATGQRDAHTNTLCPALDSDVKDFAFSPIEGTARDIVEYLSMLEYYLTNNARAMGLDPATWAIVMRPQLWQELSAVWPCKYNTNKCASSTAAGTTFIDGRENVSERDAMRNGRYIDINGSRYPVLLDDGIYEYTNATNGNLLPGQYGSSIYMVPLTITGGFPVTYLEHVDYRAAGSDIALLRGKESFWSDDGRFFWAYLDNRFCYQLTAKTEPRVILRTPQLAGRIDRVKYSPLQHLRDFNPSSSYFYDGGVSVVGNSSFYAVWK